ncbi:MAG TPA: hypothetical protein VGH19_01740 [Verrucomicrobiae bacterium]
MHVYADTSIIFSLCHPGDIFFEQVNRKHKRLRPLIIYPPWLRFEARHILNARRQDEDGEMAWRALLAAERFFMGSRENWLAVIQQAGLLSARHGRDIVCGGMDVLHVASAVHFGADEFWTGDSDQAAFARLSGLSVVDFSKVPSA